MTSQKVRKVRFGWSGLSADSSVVDTSKSFRRKLGLAPEGRQGGGGAKLLVAYGQQALSKGVGALPMFPRGEPHVLS